MLFSAACKETDGCCCYCNYCFGLLSVSDSSFITPTKTKSLRYVLLRFALSAGGSILLSSSSALSEIMLSSRPRSGYPRPYIMADVGSSSSGFSYYSLIVLRSTKGWRLLDSTESKMKVCVSGYLPVDFFPSLSISLGVAYYYCWSNCCCNLLGCLMTLVMLVDWAICEGKSSPDSESMPSDLNISGVLWTSGSPPPATPVIELLISSGFCAEA